MKKIVRYLNPLARLGTKKYSLFFPLLINIVVTVLSEFYAFEIARDPMAVGTYIIFLNVALIIYFSFRDGFKGGLISAITSVIYYLYIIFTREYRGEQLNSGLETTAVLGLIFLALAATIGFLKQRIDVLIVREIAARQIAEDGKLQLQTILQQLPVGVLLVEANGKTMEGNRQLEKILGRRISGTLNLNPSYQSLYTATNNQNLSTKDWPIVRALTKGEVVTAEEMEFLKDDQQKLLLRVNAAPVKNKNNHIIAAVSTLYDVTREKELENRKDDFINMASHELKTPLTSMKIYIEILSNIIKKSHDPKSTKVINSIKNQTERLQELINDLLDVSRIQTGKLNFNKEQFYINELVTEAVEVLQSTTDSRKLILKAAPKIKVSADRFRIYQVLTNLITNAIKYSGDSTDIIINIKKDTNKVIISVQDFGIGISKSEQKRVFDRLYQVTDPTEKTFPGLGMGLYISHEIIKRHKGKIWVEGDKGKGSTFFFTLPRAK